MSFTVDLSSYPISHLSIHDFDRSIDPDHELDEEQPSVGAESAERTEIFMDERLGSTLEECSVICSW